MLYKLMNSISRFRIAAVLAALLTLTACSRGYQATIVYFNEQEGAQEPYRTRMIVTPRYMRLDDDDDEGDFVLFDRNKRVIYSTNAMDQRTLVIRWKETGLSTPANLKNRNEKLDEKVPPVGNNEVRRYRLYTNGEVCYDLYAARSLLPNVVKAMAEFQQTLAVEHAAFMLATTLQTSSPCDQMSNVYQPARFLKYGFPIHARDYLGRIRQLADYKTDQTVSRDLFKLPAGYEQFTTEQMRSGALPQ
jgi:hypothetical protein